LDNYAKLSIIKKKLHDLKPHPKNPRRHPKAQMRALAKSLEQFAYAKGSICIQKDTNLILAGHAIRDQLLKSGYMEADVVELDFDDTKSLAFLTADNQLAILGEWDDEQLQKNLDTLKDLKFDLPDMGFDGDSLKSATEDTFDIDAALEEEGEPISKTGDVWRCGDKHRVMCGDSTKVEDVERLMQGEKAELFLTDPPYGVRLADKNTFLNEYDKGKRIQTPIEQDNQTLDDLSVFWKVVCENVYLFTKQTASYYWFACQGGNQMMMSINDAKWKVRHELIWVKNNHVLGRADYNYKHEPILYGWKQDGTHKFYGGFQTSVLEFDKPLKSDLHPTMKPVKLVELLITNSTQKNDCVLDPFLGSGTTLIAAEKTGRRCFGMEISPHYCDLICRRYYDFTGDLPINDATQEPFLIS